MNLQVLNPELFEGVAYVRNTFSNNPGVYVDIHPVGFSKYKNRHEFSPVATIRPYNSDNFVTTHNDLEMSRLLNFPISKKSGEDLEEFEDTSSVPATIIVGNDPMYTKIIYAIPIFGDVVSTIITGDTYPSTDIDHAEYSHNRFVRLNERVSLPNNPNYSRDYRNIIYGGVVVNDNKYQSPIISAVEYQFNIQKPFSTHRTNYLVIHSIVKVDDRKYGITVQHVDIGTNCKISRPHHIFEKESSTVEQEES